MVKRLRALTLKRIFLIALHRLPAKPPVTKAPPGRDRTELTFRENPTVDSRRRSEGRVGRTDKAISIPRLRSTPPLDHWAVQPDEAGTACCSKRSTMVRW